MTTQKLTMKKFLNDPNDIAAELLEGYTLAYANKVSLMSEKIVVRANPKPEDKVALVTLGGAGHEPALSGFVGEGMLDASVVGDIFAAPGAPKLLEALRAFNRDAGVLLVVLNHAGDVMSANMAMELAKREGLNVRMLLTHEDISAGLDTPDEDRRGLAGCVPLYKVAGAAAEAGKSLDEVIEIAERFNKQMATLAVAMTGATHPQNGQAISELPDDEMEIGMGQHGEAGGGRTKILSADETAEKMIEPLVQSVDAKSGDQTMLIINGVGATTLMEMNLVFRKAYRLLEAKGIDVVSGMIDEILTVQEMAGFQMILCKLDADHIPLMKAPCDTPYWTVR
ncbi:PTS-dependent dihydroxyacetone kinase, dihydroxyacetone-binding subunit DhaK [Planctomycetes bacterium CA13]|uniref:PTS-dependent dihydroxyacetone kinase, dihydroxyacetone-binding subunit DhaK n=2 Tax=Novipirellula herctigrandis TaxID=2527986 RepID=A0A5C5YZ10_9BACT|nr:PTS-dependent dihydroxyacetone kinase, dihydroxyacetone-binding subunit DhaK [Planctomycetes bacterium CA13]